MSEGRSSLEVTVHEVKRMRDAGEDFLLLDVRQPEEYEMARIAGSELIPMSELPARLEELRPHASRPIVVYCHRGMRSLQATHWLRQQGFDSVHSMAGGIDAWSLQIEPGVPRY